MTFDEFMERLLEFLPNATVANDNDGQIIVYTNLRHTEGGLLGEFDPE